MINILNKFGSVLSMNFVVMVIIIGLILLIWDRKVLYRKKEKKEHFISMILGIVYISLGVVLFIVGKII